MTRKIRVEGDSAIDDLRRRIAALSRDVRRQERYIAEYEEDDLDYTRLLRWLGDRLPKAVPMADDGGGLDFQEELLLRIAYVETRKDLRRIRSMRRAEEEELDETLHGIRESEEELVELERLRGVPVHPFTKENA